MQRKTTTNLGVGAPFLVAVELPPLAEVVGPGPAEGQGPIKDLYETSVPWVLTAKKLEKHV